ncbi:MAG: CpsB/CapC family capsule biosynthesis tyrosine phosphatase [Aristaeellaceae bacterium]
MIHHPADAGKPAILQTVRACMLGHAIADAMGVPVEFSSRAERMRDPVTGYRGYGTHDVPAGTWSDDTSMALASLDSLSRGLDCTDMMERFCDWKDHAAYTATGEVFDMGITTGKALSQFQKGTPALSCGLDGEYDNGNGSLMRIIPAALYCRFAAADLPLDKQLAVIHDVSALTHRHPRSQMGCGICALILMALCDGRGLEGIQEGVDRAKRYYAADPAFSQELSRYARILNSPSVMAFAQTPEEAIRSGGYVVDTLEAALWCVLNTDNYRDCVLKAVNLGGDTDTVAAVAGGLAGCLYGMEGIPEDWLAGLRKAEDVEALCKAFASSVAPAEALSGPADRRDSIGPLPGTHLSFAFDFPITARDLAMFRSEGAGGSPDFHWRLGPEDELFIFREHRCVCRLRISPEADRHQACFCSLGDALRDVSPRETLLHLLTRWTGHEERLKAVDLHCHVVPGVDDGAQSLDMALQMLRMEAGQGVQHIVCTSHSFGMRDGRYRKNLQQLQQALAAQQMKLSLYPGCEIHCPGKTPESVLQRVQRGEYALLGNSGHMLLEFDPDSSSASILACVRQILALAAASDAKAKHVVLAHAERYRRLADDADALDALLALGCRIQINAYSLAEEPKPSTKAFARRLLDERKVSFLGSDAHRTEHRPPCMKNGIRYVYDHCDVDYANAVCYENARQLLTGALG